MQLGHRGLREQRRPVGDFGKARLNGFQRRTKTEKGQTSQWPVVEISKVQLLEFGQDFLGVFGGLAGILRLVAGIKRAGLLAQSFGLVIGFRLDAVLVIPEAGGQFNQQFRPEPLFNGTLRVASPVGKTIRTGNHALQFAPNSRHRQS